MSNWKKERDRRNKEAKKRVDVLVKKYPRLKAIRKYFSKKTENNSYKVILRQEAQTLVYNILADEPNVTLRMIGNILNISHSQVVIIGDMKLSERHRDYNEIAPMLEEVINKKIYPKAIRKFNSEIGSFTIFEWQKVK